MREETPTFAKCTERRCHFAAAWSSGRPKRSEWAQKVTLGSERNQHLSEEDIRPFFPCLLENAHEIVKNEDLQCSPCRTGIRHLAFDGFIAWFCAEYIEQETQWIEGI